MRAPWLLLLAACGTQPPRPDAGDVATLPDAHPSADAQPIGSDATIVPDAGPGPDAYPPTGIEAQITINEVMTYNALTAVDETGAAADWVELYNPTDEDVDLAGFTMTDDPAIPVRAVIPAGVVIRARGYLVLWLDHAPERGPRHLGFRLAREGGDLVLAHPGGAPIDRVTYGTQAVDFSAAREPDGSDHWVIEWHASPGAPNPSGAGVAMGPEDPLAPPELIPAAGDPSERLLGDDVLLDLAIAIRDDDLAALAAHPFVDVPGTLTVYGRAYGPVGVRLKGANSFLPIDEKPSLRINIDEYVPRAELFGLKDLTLNNMSGDTSMLHERIAYRVARMSGIPASRANHARVTINGTSYGLYANVETVKRKMLSRWFNDPHGALFEAKDVDFVDEDVAAYELESGKDDRNALAGLAEALEIEDPDAALAAASTYVGIQHFLEFWAMESVIGQYDAMPYSLPGDDYFVYLDLAAGRLTFLPWGMDESLYSPELDPSERLQSVLARKCAASATCFQAYVDRTWDLLAAVEAADVAGEVKDIADEIAADVVADVRKPYTTDTVLASQRSARSFLANRRSRLASFLPPHS